MRCRRRRRFPGRAIRSPRRQTADGEWDDPRGRNRTFAVSTVRTDRRPRPPPTRRTAAAPRVPSTARSDRCRDRADREGSNRISAKNSAATMSAAEQQLVGWPLPASDVDIAESIRSRVAMLLRAGMSVDRSTGGSKGTQVEAWLDSSSTGERHADCEGRWPVGSAQGVVFAMRRDLCWFRIFLFTLSVLPGPGVPRARGRTRRSARRAPDSHRPVPAGCAWHRRHTPRRIE